MACHGSVRQLGGLIFLFEEDIYKPLRSGAMAVVPGNPAESKMYRRVISEKEAIVMPPEGGKLTEAETELIRRWREEGAKWEERTTKSFASRPY